MTIHRADYTPQEVDIGSYCKYPITDMGAYRLYWKARSGKIVNRDVLPLINAKVEEGLPHYYSLLGDIRNASRQMFPDIFVSAGVLHVALVSMLRKSDLFALLPSRLGRRNGYIDTLTPDLEQVCNPQNLRNLPLMWREQFGYLSCDGLKHILASNYISAYYFAKYLVTASRIDFPVTRYLNGWGDFTLENANTFTALISCLADEGSPSDWYQKPGEVFSRTCGGVTVRFCAVGTPQNEIDKFCRQ